MADDLGHRIGSSNEPQEPPRANSEPPPLGAIRVKPPRPKGLNKPAIIAVAGGAAAVVLILASGTFSTDANKKPTEAKPMMSDPARPEMAKNAVRDLPATYSEAGSFLSTTQPAQAPPLLGPPLPGDIAAFAPDQPSISDGGIYDHWDQPAAASSVSDPAVDEAREAERSHLFFALREDAKLQPAPAPQQVRTPNPLNLLQQRPTPQLSAPAEGRTLHPGAIIPASLVTSINSEAPGPVIAQVTQSIYDSATGRVLLIPQGARLIGEYRSGAKYGQKRLAILWSRLIMPDGSELTLDEGAMDPSGAAAISGKVDNHWSEVFGAAALGTLINIGVAATEDPALTYGGIGVVARDPVDAALAEGAQRTASIVTNRVVDRSLTVPPTIRIEAGKRIAVITTRRFAL